MTKAAAVGDESTPIPKTLYHYTAFSKFIEIFGSKSIWSTDLRYLNDKSEYRDALNMMSIVAKEFLNDKMAEQHLEIVARPFIEQFLQRIVSAAENPIDFDQWQVFTVSFSECEDDLSQWRAYARPSGVAVGFDFQSLMDIGEAQNFNLEKCIYDSEKKKIVVKELIERYVNILAFGWSDLGSDRFLDEQYRAMNWFFLQKACTFKDDAFEREKEWRLIGKMPVNPHNMRFHATGTLLFPHLPLSFAAADRRPPRSAEVTKNGRQVRTMLPPGDGRELMIKVPEIVIGPTNEPSLNGFTAEQIVLKADLDKPHIRHTRAPYREIL